MSKTDKHVIIVAGGLGTRMKSALPKQFMLLNNLPVLMHTLKRFHAFDPEIEILLVLPESLHDAWQQLIREHQFSVAHSLVKGGENRFGSVKNALNEIGMEGLVAIHDGVRPLVSNATIQRCFEMAFKKGNAIPVMPLVESVRQLDGEKNKAVDRSAYVSIQTPQVFRLAEIKEAYKAAGNAEFTDDASVLEALNKEIFLVEGNRENIKITHAIDLEIARVLSGTLE